MATAARSVMVLLSEDGGTHLHRMVGPSTSESARRFFYGLLFDRVVEVRRSNSKTIHRVGGADTIE